jgi:transcriptional regulator with XRE-family HTH domain
MRAGRGLLGWSQRRLSERSGVAIAAVQRAEAGDVETRPRTMKALRQAMEAEGVVFLPESDAEGEGVRLAKPDAVARGAG